jgi:PEP-CTERM motif
MTFFQLVFCGLAIGLFTANPAMARRIQIDGAYSAITPCTIGAPCTPLSIPFSANFGQGAFNSVYVYDNGLVSFGVEIAAGSDLSSLAAIGSNVFTAGYSPGGLMSLSTFEIQDPGLGFDATGRLLGKPVFRVRYAADIPGGPTVPVAMQFSIFDVGADEFALQLAHGSAGVFGIASDAYLGYSFGGLGVQRSGPSLVSDVTGGSVDFEYFFTNRGGGTVPEPSSLTLMFLGFVVLGSTVKRRSNVQAVLS